MKGLIERLRGYEFQTFNRGDLSVEKRFRRQAVNYVEERILTLSCSGGDDRVCLNDFLPDGWEFRELDGLLSVWENYGRRIIWVPDVILDENIYKTPFLASRSSLRTSESSGEASHVFLLMKGALLGLLHGLAHVRENGGVIDDVLLGDNRLRKLHRSTPLGQFSDEDREDYMELVIGSELRAWDGANEMLQGFRLDGLDLEPEMSDEEIQLFVEGCIKGYLM